jgi:hypothetical protein
LRPSPPRDGDPGFCSGPSWPDHGPAWLAHFLVERNRPATFRHPLWSLRADYRMLRLWLTGRLEDQLRQAGLR